MGSGGAAAFGEELLGSWSLGRCFHPSVSQSRCQGRGVDGWASSLRLPGTGAFWARIQWHAFLTAQNRMGTSGALEEGRHSGS